ncbi:uncharacterized protein LOC144642148 [Oculina patagonica]
MMTASLKMRNSLVKGILAFMVAVMCILIQGSFGGKCSPINCTAIVPGCTEDCGCSNYGYGPTVRCNNREIESVPRVLIESMPNDTRTLYLYTNRIKTLPKSIFRGLLHLKTLDLGFNKIRKIASGAFKDLIRLKSLNANFMLNEQLVTIKRGSLLGLRNLTNLAFHNNGLKTIDEHAFEDLISVTYLDMAENKLREIKPGMFLGLKSLETLWLEENKITIIHKGSFQNLRSLLTLFIEKNNITVLLHGSFDGLVSLLILEMRSSSIKYIEDKVFKDLSKLQYLGLLDNKLLAINANTLKGLANLVYIDAGENPLRSIDSHAFQDTRSLQSVNFIGISLDIIPAIYPLTPINVTLQLFPSSDPLKVTFQNNNETLDYFMLTKIGLMCMGHDVSIECILCPTGTYASWFMRYCLLCPAGGFYQDEMGYSGSATRFGNLLCKECPPGRYVHPDKAPGKAITECTSCPQGTQYNKFAMFRACPCIDQFYRFDRFGPCFQCYSVGLICRNESVDLNPGFFWKWESQESRQLYEKFKDGLRVQHNQYDKGLTKFNRSLPKVYAWTSVRCL